MKNYSLTITILLMSALTVHAQKSSIGIQAGATYSTVTFSDGGDTESQKYKTGFTLGVTMDKAIGKKLYLQPALNFVQKGMKSKYSESGKATLNYVELPFNFVYRAKKESGFFIGAGPSLGIGINGTSWYENEKDKIDFGGEGNPDRFEIGANAVAGFRFANKFQVAVSYNMGITNLTDESSAQMKNNYFALRLGYFFR